MAQFTTVSMSDVLAAKRMDPPYFLALAQIRDAQVEGVSVLDHLKATLTTAQAQELLEALPPAQTAKLLAPLAEPGETHRKASSLVHRVGQRHAHEALVLVLDQMDMFQAQVDGQVQAALATQAAVQTVAQVRPRSRRP